MYSQARNEATKRYMKKNFMQTALRIPKKYEETVKGIAASEGISLHAYLIGLLYADLEKRGIEVDKKSE